MKAIRMTARECHDETAGYRPFLKRDAFLRLADPDGAFDA
jgi:hypothetical protein